MSIDTEKVRAHLRARTQVPPELLALDFDALAACIEATGNAEAVELVAHHRERIARAGCTPCERLAAAARLRVYLTKKGNA